MIGINFIPRATSGLVSAVLLSATALVAQSRPPEPYIERGVCPFECCRYGGWTAEDSIVVYTGEGSSDTAFLLLPREQLNALTGNVHLLRAGLVVLTQPVTISGEDSFPARTLSAGDTAYVLSYRGEGWYDVWVNDTIRNVESFWDDRREYPRPTNRPAHLVSEPEDIWWVYVTTPNGRTGWIRMDQANVSGLDACG